MTYYHTPLRSSAPQQRWREEADARERKRAAVEAAGRRRERAAVQQQLQHVGFLQQQSAPATAERPMQAQLAALRSELAQAHEVTREALIEFVVRELDALSKELRVDVERQIKRRQAELEREFETKLAALRMPRVRGTYSEAEIYLQHDVCVRNGSSYIARRDSPGECPGSGWQQLSMVGRTGSKGERGHPGERGSKGESGANFLTWRIDAKRYTVTPLLSDGRQGPPLYLRELFEQFFNETRERE